jgi:hypothetical protein
MPKTATKFPIVFLTLTCILFCSGCVVQQAYIRSKPIFNEFLTKSSQLGQDYARIVFYCPTAFPFADLAPLGITIEGRNNYFHTNVMDQTAFYIDVPAGNYEITEKSGSILDGGRTISIEVKNSGRYFVKLTSDPALLSFKPPQLVEADEALKEITEKKVSSAQYDFDSSPYMRTFAMVPKIQSQWESLTGDSSHKPSAPSKSLCYFFNTKSGMVGPFIKLETGVDCEPQIIVESGKYVCYEVSCGKHTLSVHCTNLGTEVLRPVGFEFLAEEGKDNYFSFALIKGIQLLPEKDGAKLLKKYKPAKNGYLTLKE